MADTILVTQKCIAFSGSATPATPIQVGGRSALGVPLANGPAAGLMTVALMNTDATNIAYLAWGTTAAAATANAVVPVAGTPQYVVPLPVNAAPVPTMQFAAGTFFTVVSGAGTPLVLMLPGVLQTA